MTTPDHEVIYFGADPGSTQVRYAFIADSYEEISEISNLVAVFDASERQDARKKVGENPEFVDALMLKVKIDRTKKADSEQATQLISKIVDNTWLVGNIAKNISYSAKALQPSLRKSLQVEYYMNLIGALTVGMKNSGRTSAKVHMRTLVPPTEYTEEISRTIEHVFDGAKLTIENVLTGDVFVLEFIKVEVRDEGRAALAYCLVDETGQPTEISRVVRGNLLILLDNGENTFDVVQLLDGKPVGGKVKTLGNGAKMIMTFLANNIENEYKFRPNLEELRKIYQTGRVKIGAIEADAQSFISAANKEFVEKSFNSFENYLLTNDLSLQSISGFIFIGGGSVESGKNTLSMPQAFMGKVAQVVEGIPKHAPKDPRRANILGVANTLRRLRDKAAKAV